jgi:hypothetical protein
MAESNKLNMKSKILSLLGIGAIAFAVACNSSDDETTNADSSTVTTTDNTASSATGSASVQTTADGKRYVVRTRTGTSSTSGTATSGTTTGPEYDTVWLWMGTEDRYYTLGGNTGKDTLYFDSDEWKAWWSKPETDNELKAKSGDTKVKIDDDGSWKVKDGNSKTKSDEDGKVKTKPKGN